MTSGGFSLALNPLFCIADERLIFGLTAALNLLVVAIDGALILLELLLIGLILLLFLTLHVIADERASAKSEGAADGGAGSGMTHGCTDDAAGGRAANCTNPSALFPGRHRSAGTSGKHHSREDDRSYT
jgi:hypothetical protein